MIPFRGPAVNIMQNQSMKGLFSKSGAAQLEVKKVTRQQETIPDRVKDRGQNPIQFFLKNVFQIGIKVL